MTVTGPAPGQDEGNGAPGRGRRPGERPVGAADPGYRRGEAEETEGRQDETEDDGAASGRGLDGARHGGGPSPGGPGRSRRERSSAIGVRIEASSASQAGRMPTTLACRGWAAGRR
jgi:hypothetical protein